MRALENEVQPREGDREYVLKGYDPETGKPIYESNFPLGTPKAAKSEHILELIQDVWSKAPITLVINEKDGAERKIKAQFDPTYNSAEGMHTDASKLMGGNRHGTASEQRVTLDLADDYYQIASDAVYNYSKDEIGKDSAPHQGVTQWHYFINDILFQEHGQKETTPYRVTINVKERSDGHFVYSFNAERQNKGSSTRQTLHADVTAAEGSSNARPNTTIAEIPPGVKNNSMQNTPKNSSSGKLSFLPPEMAEQESKRKGKPDVYQEEGEREAYLAEENDTSSVTADAVPPSPQGEGYDGAIDENGEQKINLYIVKTREQIRVG